MNLPNSWKKIEISEEDKFEIIFDEEDNENVKVEIIEQYETPMEGWDDEHPDILKIIKTSKGYKIELYLAFFGYDETQVEYYSTLEEVQGKALKAMELNDENSEQEGES